MNQPEFWLRGPVKDVPALLQPVAHALLQADDEIKTALASFPQDKLWNKPAGVASVGFHLQHIPGVLDRLFTYAVGGQLSFEQLKYLSEEGLENESLKLNTLLDHLSAHISLSINKLKEFREEELASFRGVGRKQLPSTLLGLLFHSAEHTMRHTGQLIVTAKILSENE
ncbi:MAG: DinB family protein [Chitinophagaceae bacterium]|nr:DinB family protein [Chitinophagaceae bacterium]